MLLTYVIKRIFQSAFVLRKYIGVQLEPGRAFWSKQSTPTLARVLGCYVIPDMPYVSCVTSYVSGVLFKPRAAVDVDLGRVRGRYGTCRDPNELSIALEYAKQANGMIQSKHRLIFHYVLESPY